MKNKGRRAAKSGDTDAMSFLFPLSLHVLFLLNNNPCPLISKEEENDDGVKK
jgi:hypothetical protein